MRGTLKNCFEPLAKAWLRRETLSKLIPSSRPTERGEPKLLRSWYSQPVCDSRSRRHPGQRFLRSLPASEEDARPWIKRRRRWSRAVAYGWKVIFLNAWQ